jgi:hypothetical protein
MSPPHRPETIYLHIGLEKTGTSALQAVGSLNRYWLARRGVLYSRVAGHFTHSTLALYASEGSRYAARRGVVGLETATDFENQRSILQRGLKAEFARTGCKTVWLSSEHLSSRVKGAARTARLAELLQPLAERVRVVVYLRHQPELYLSSYSTLVRLGNDIAIDDRHPRTNNYFYRFDKILDSWAESFGRDALIVRIFDRRELKNGDVIDDFFDVLGITRDATMNTPKKQNRRLDGQTLQFMRVFNRHVPPLIGSHRNPDYDDAATLLENVSTYTPLAISGRAMRRIANMFEPFNQDVARKYLGRPDGNLFQQANYEGMTPTPEINVEAAKSIGLALCDAKGNQIRELAKGRYRPVERQLALLEQDARDRLNAATSVDDAVRAAIDIWLIRQRYLQNMQQPEPRSAPVPAQARPRKEVVLS